MLFGSKNVKNLNSSEFQKHLTENDNSILIDVRTQEEHEEIRIPNSMLIDISQADFLDKINKLDKQKSYYLYCRSGSRSLNAATKMDKLGFEKVYNLAGGIIAWDGATER
ncbi:MAG: rhodanese [Ignavibacteriae bacterium]|nr:MAG: rhodanese [Ignavibacteriota bacterium]